MPRALLTHESHCTETVRERRRAFNSRTRSQSSPLRPETERRVNPTPRSRMIKRDRCVAIGNGTESSSVSSDEQLSFSARRRWGGKKQKGPFSGNVPPSNISPCGHRSTAATFEQNRQMSICHRVGMCYFYLGYFYLHLFPWRQVTTLCLNT